MTGVTGVAPVLHVNSGQTDGLNGKAPAALRIRQARPDMRQLDFRDVTSNTTRTEPVSGSKKPQLSGRTFEVSRAANFEAAHHLAPKDPSHPYGRLHGHSFRVEIAASGTVKAGEDWVADFADLGDVLKKVTEVLDHAYLNEIEGLELPTLERICVWIADFVAADLPGLTRVSVSRPSLSETCTLRLNP